MATLPETTLDDVEATSARDARSGLLVGILCYCLWGFLPLLFRLLNDVSSVTIVADRTLWSLVFVGALLLIGGRMHEVRTALRDPGTLRSMALSAGLLAINWLVYVWAVETNQVLEASFGYFINPLVNVAIGMVLLGERLNRWQTVAVLIALLSIVLQAIGIGRVPFIALTLAVSFGFYGFFRKTAKVNSTSGLFAETLLLAPIAAGYLAFIFISEGGPGLHADPYHLVLLALTGPATAVPLLLFAFAVKRLRLASIGMLQYIAPSIQFFLAVFLFHEGINLMQLLGFGLIWLSLAIYTTDSVMRRPGTT